MKYTRRRRDSFHDESLLGRYVTAPFNRIGEWIAKRFKGDQGEIGGRGVFERASSLPRRLLDILLVGPMVFLVTSWASSRQSLHFFLGLPALMTAFVAVAPGLAFISLKDQIRKSYDGLSARAITLQDPQAAELLTQKLFALEPENRDYYFRLASTIGESKQDSDYALQLIEQVAIGSETGNINGHLWIAQYLISKPAELSEEEIAKADGHLQQALIANPDHFTAHQLAFELFTKANRPEDAIIHAEEVAKAEPLTSHLLLKLQKDLGRDAEFEETLSNVLLVLSEVAYRNPNEIGLWGELVACCLQGERYQEAISYVQTGLALSSNQTVRTQLSLLVSTVLISWHDKLMTFNDKTQQQQAVISLNAALNIFAGNGEAIRRASKLYLDPNLDSTRMDWIMDTLSRDDNSYCTHMLIGWRALFLDKESGVATARVHWQIADTSSPLFVSVLGQLALGIATLEPDKIPFSLQSIELAMSIAPTRTELGEARGLILMKAERWFEARQQFEEVLPNSERPSLVLTKLIECCEKLDDKIKLEEFRAQLERISRPTSSPL